MRVVLLVTDLERGGTPLRLARLARGLRCAGVEVHVGCLGPPGPVSRELDGVGIPTFACGAAGAWDLRALWRLGRHVRRIRPDLLHATLTHANVAARLVGGWLGVPVLTSTATIEVERRWHLAVERWTAWMDHGHIVNSAALADHVVKTFGLARRRVHVVPPAIDPPPQRGERSVARRQLGLPEDAFVVLWAGRLDRVKRLEVALRCVELLAGAGCHLVLAGDGPERQRLQRRAARSPAQGRIRFLGWVTDLGPALSAADVFLCPSRTEGMPNAVLEAMAFGLPIVGSDIPALRELSGAEGRLVLVAGGDAGAWAAELQVLRNDAARRAALGRRAAEWARARLDPQRAARALLGVYERVLAGRR